ncbi:MAG: UDP-galactopyranose mutase [Lachnospiraceae bacterium]|nr:UDP-galactopyranose mutase [Lachnospiraceae bacterium]
MGKYDLLIVGAGLYGAVFAERAAAAGKKVLVIDKRAHIGGNIYTELNEGIQVHMYGAHIFHTSDSRVWEYVNRFAGFNNYRHCLLAVYKDELYNLPFNMNTFSKMWGIRTPAEAREKIAAQVAQAGISEAANLEEQAVSLVGRDIYEKLIEGYTRKQWGRECRELPAFIIKRLPVRFVYDNNYFNDIYQGIPEGGYTAMVQKMLSSAEVELDTDFYADREHFMSVADRIVFTGMIDEFYDHCFGRLEYRGLKFETEILDTENFQGNAVVNYTEYEIPYTRIIEHKHFELKCQGGERVPKTVITREYPAAWKPGDEPYYPVNDDKNNALYERYRELAAKEGRVIFGGRLGGYRYLDMDKVVAMALDDSRESL